ncbi:hypothetical protein RRG08_003438 [Elysia crispata]|uniref:C2H2-type domain-containing protein n=1 Tax=Elysia crispata TaxID=231223 RepID=A0AAE1ABT0_9GAST|nr:hypothetical protein RRG08_003438 [Elysia crispata]
MNKVRLNEAQQTLEAVNLSGCIFIYLDDKPSVRLSFSQKLKVYFDIVDNSQTFTSGCHLRALAAFDHNQTTDTSYEESCACAEDSIILSEVGQDRFFANSDNDISIARLTHEDSSLSIPHLGAASDRVGLKEDFYSLEGGSHQLLIQCDTSSDDKQANLFDEKNLTKQEGANSNPLSQDNEKCSSKEQFSYYKSSKAERRDVKFSKSKIAPSQLRLKCSHCSITFSSKARLAAHNRMPGCIKQCEKCGENFLCFADLFIHQYRKYDPDFMAQNYPLLSILKSDDCKSTQCPFCTIKFQSASSLLKHLQVKHFSDATYACCMCDRAFKTFSLLNSHRVKCSSKKQRKKNISKFASTTKSEDDSLLVAGSVKICNSSYNSLAEGLMDIDGKNNLMQSRSNTELQEKIQNSENEMQKVNLLKFQQNSCSSDYTLSAVEPEVPKLANLQSEHTCSYCTKTFPSSAEKEAHNRLSKCVHERQFHEEMVKGSFSGTKKSSGDIDKSSLHRCPLCWKSVIRLRKHVALCHTGEMLYQCCVCGKKFSSSATLKRHCDDHLKERKGKFQCSKCPMVTNNHSDFFKHAATHRSQCVFCKTEFGHSHLLWSHYLSQHEDELFTCNTCGKKIATKEQLETHMKYHRFTHFQPCPKCGIMIKGSLKKHLKRKHHGELDETDNKTMIPITGAEENVDGHTSSFNSNNYQCHNCPESFSNNQSLTQHRKSHNGKNIPCPNCNKTFSTKSILTKHIDRVHLKISRHICDICGKKATSSYNLKVHKRIHSTTKLFNCDLCDQGFNYKASLQGHMRSKHSGHQFEAMKNTSA